MGWLFRRKNRLDDEPELTDERATEPDYDGSERVLDAKDAKEDFQRQLKASAEILKRVE